MLWVSVLLIAEGPLAVGIAWATGHSGTALGSCSYSSPEMLARPSSDTQTTCSKTEMNKNILVLKQRILRKIYKSELIFVQDKNSLNSF